MVLLGPGTTQERDYSKRCQIRDLLQQKGYNHAVLGEEALGPAPDLPLNLALFTIVPQTDLILVLETGPAPLTEITTLMSIPRAREITRVWCLRDHIGQRRSTPADVVKSFETYLFIAEEFATCSLSESFIETADRFCVTKGMYDGIIPSLGLYQAE